MMDNFVIRKKKRPLDDTTVGVDTADDTEDENVEEKADKLEFHSAMDTLENSLVNEDESIDIKHEPLEDLEPDSNPVIKKRGMYIFLKAYMM